MVEKFKKLGKRKVYCKCGYAWISKSISLHPSCPYCGRHTGFINARK